MKKNLFKLVKGKCICDICNSKVLATQTEMINFPIPNTQYDSMLICVCYHCFDIGHDLLNIKGYNKRYTHMLNTFKQLGII